MKRLTTILVLVSVFVTGCHTVPVYESYASDCYDCYDRHPAYRYDRTYVYDYSVPLALTAGVALGYVLSDGHYHRPHKVVHPRHHRPYRYVPRGRGFRH